jgi:16S rRNA (cytosine1402-N4)-methyltransferase
MLHDAFFHAASKSGGLAFQVDAADRGFSFAQDGPLDMRMGPHAGHSAEEIVNTWSEADLGRILREYGEERAWRRMAQRLVEVSAHVPSQQAVPALWSKPAVDRQCSSCALLSGAL